MAKTRRRRGYQIKQRPGEYSRTPQIQKVIDAAEFCGVRKGISKSELMEKMVNCIPQYHKEHKDGDKSVHIKALPTMPGS